MQTCTGEHGIARGHGQKFLIHNGIIHCHSGELQFGKSGDGVVFRHFQRLAVDLELLVVKNVGKELQAIV